MTHDLKTDPRPFDAVHRGAKTFEIRRADRPFDILDLLHLRETVFSREEMDIDFRPLAYTGREVLARVTHILRESAYGLTPGFCVLSFAIVETSDQPIPLDRIQPLDWNAPSALDPETLARVEAWRLSQPIPRRAGPPLRATAAMRAAYGNPDTPPTLAGLIASGKLVVPEVHTMDLTIFRDPGKPDGILIKAKPGAFLDAAEVEAGMKAIRENPAEYMRMITDHAGGSISIRGPLTKEELVEAQKMPPCPGRTVYPPVTSWEQVQPAADKVVFGRTYLPPVDCHECFGSREIAGRPCPHCTAKKRR